VGSVLEWHEPYEPAVLPVLMLDGTRTRTRLTAIRSVLRPLSFLLFFSWPSMVSLPCLELSTVIVSIFCTRVQQDKTTKGFELECVASPHSPLRFVDHMSSNVWTRGPLVFLRCECPPEGAWSVASDGPRAYSSTQRWDGMKVGKVGHASLLVTSGRVRCLMDPVFTDPFESGTNTFEPPISIDAPRLVDGCNLIVISHAHFDHFSIRTLALFDRSCTVVYPKGDKLIELALKRLGFENLEPVGVTGDEVDTLEIFDMQLIPTRSAASFPEMGMLFKSGSQSFWNVVDTTLDAAAIANALHFVEGDGGVGLLAAYYQPLIEGALRQDGLGSSFPFEHYGRLLTDVAKIAPEAVFPGSCGLRYCRAAWMDARGFPMTDEQFLRDVAKLVPGVLTRQLPPGSILSLDDGYSVQPNAIEGVSLTSPRTSPCYSWRPDRGVSPVEDTNPFTRSTASLRKRITDYFEQTFVSRLSRPENRGWARRLSSIDAHWRIEIVFPDGKPDVRWCRFSGGRVSLTEDAQGLFAAGHTTIAASLLVDILDGKISSYAARLGSGAWRVSTRLYEVTSDGAKSIGDAHDDPISHAILRDDDLDRRWVEQELEELGC
jgi:hypothetical protein